MLTKTLHGYGEIAKHKAEDINEMFKDKEIDAIFCAMRRLQLQWSI